MLYSKEKVFYCNNLQFHREEPCSGTSWDFLAISRVHNSLKQVFLSNISAFLHGDIDEEVYMKQPEGFVIPGKEHLICKFNRSLYGLKQASRQWYKKFDAIMLKRGYKRSHVDHCLYTNRDENGSPIILYYM